MYSEFFDKIVRDISTKHDEALEEAMMIEVKQIAANHGLTTIVLNPKLVTEALIRQMPKKVYDRRHFHPLSYLYFGNCPVCNELQTAKYNYCGKCGQKLDWEADV